MADDNAHVRRHVTAARDHMAGIEQRRKAAHALIAEHQAKRALELAAKAATLGMGGKP